jgi:CRISPR-associated endonuclease/helicase Cas3
MELNGNLYWSHPNKPLINHISGVINNAKKLAENTSAEKWAELTAIYHDLGKINPNFQEKLKPIPNPQGYANHAYMSAYSFFVAFGCVSSNRGLIADWLGVEKISKNDLITLTIIIAKHHGNLPNYCPIDIDGTGSHILSKDENEALHKFLNEKLDLPIDEYSKYFFSEIESFESILRDNKTQKGYIEKFIFNAVSNQKALDFYLDTQYAFACLIQGDKTDAAKFDVLVDNANNGLKQPK